jgi:hypothetical protein
LTVRRIAPLILCIAALLGAMPSLDSQLVLQRYELELADLKAPKTSIFQYSVSQAGASSIEERHQLYRSGTKVRDETLAVDGKRLAEKNVQIGERPDRYFVGRLAPRSTTYTMLFLHAVRDGKHLDYVYDVSPLIAAATGFTVTRVTVDGINYLPKSIEFRTSAGATSGTGSVTYGKAGRYWVPLAATVDATVDGKRTRERIEWSDYRFPATLPASTFNTPKPLPEATLPPL